MVYSISLLSYVFYTFSRNQCVSDPIVLCVCTQRFQLLSDVERVCDDTGRLTFYCLRTVLASLINKHAPYLLTGSI